MTEITERRLKCDYCGNVSPVFEGGKLPMGWSRLFVLTAANEKRPPVKHFCTRAHHEQWIDVQFSGLPEFAPHTLEFIE